MDYSQYTSLHLAVSKCHYDTVDVLLAAGADTELYTATGCCGTALHLASSMGNSYWFSNCLYNVHIFAVIAMTFCCSLFQAVDKMYF